MQAPDQAAYVARATEAADASSASSVRALGLRHVRLAVPTADGAIRARVTVDRATETVDVAIRGADDVGLSAARRVSELREGLAHHGLKLGVFDASPVTTDVARNPAPILDPSAPEGSPGTPDGAERDASAGANDRGAGRDPHADELPHADGRAPARHLSTDAVPLRADAAPRRAPNRWEDDAPVGQLLDRRI